MLAALLLSITSIAVFGGWYNGTFGNPGSQPDPEGGE